MASMFQAYVAQILILVIMGVSAVVFFFVMFAPELKLGPVDFKTLLIIALFVILLSAILCSHLYLL